MAVPYGKGWLSTEDQIVLLRLRGLVIDDPEAMIGYFKHVNFYRFGGYCRPFLQAKHTFIPGTTFSRVRAIYDFDGALRELLVQAIKIFEIDLRTCLAHSFGKTHGCFGHTRPASFHHTFNHREWLASLQLQALRSRETFVATYRKRYLEFPDLPIWTVAEIMSFATLSEMFGGLLVRDQAPVVERYAVKPVVLASWLHHLVYIRNLCLHHSRVWDRLWSVSPRLPRAFDWMPPSLPDGRHVFVTLLILSQLLDQCPGQGVFAARWRTAVEHLIHGLPPVPDGLARMGLTPEWDKQPQWIQHPGGTV